MESIIIIIAGLIFSVISKSVKDKQEVEKERNKRKQQLSQSQQSTYSQPDQKQKSLREIFMEELDKVGDEDGNLGDIFRSSFGDKQQKGIQVNEVETSNTDYDDVSEEDYKEALEARNAAYMESSDFGEDHITQSESIVGNPKSNKEIGIKIQKEKIRDNRQYNPFTKSLNRKDVIRGIIFSEVLDKPKSLRNQKRSM